MTASPILVIGLPRSGTTWVAKILDSHPDTLYRHEPDSRCPLDEVGLFSPPDASTVAVRRFLDGLPSLRSVAVAGKVPVFRKRYLPGWRNVARRCSVYLGKALDGWCEMPVQEPLSDPESARLVWKSIESTGRVGLLAAAAPTMNIVHLLRHPAGQIESTLRGESLGAFGADSASANDWGIFELLAETRGARQRSLDMAAFRGMTPIERLAWKWVLVNEKALFELESVSTACSLRYEDICSAPERHARELLAFLGLSWESSVGDFLSLSTSGAESGYYGVMREPVTAAQGWRARLPVDVQEQIRQVVENTVPGQLYYGNTQADRRAMSDGGG